MYNAKGEKTWEADLDIYGKVRTFAGRSLSECPFRYQGQYEDSETGLYYNRFRYYDPTIGSYISQDPIGLAGGMVLYGYVHDTNGWVDKFGLRSKIDSSKLTKPERESLVSKRPSRYRTGVVEEVWENAKDPVTGKVFDPNDPDIELTWDKSKNRHGQWDMGHIKGKSYDDLKNQFIEGEITYQQYLDEYNNPKNYYPEEMSSNRSNKHTH
jgi:RHS repeat-associated protein